MKDDARAKLAAARETANVNASEGIQATLAVLEEYPSEPEILDQLDSLLHFAIAFGRIDSNLLRDPRMPARMKLKAAVDIAQRNVSEGIRATLAVLDEHPSLEPEILQLLDGLLVIALQKGAYEQFDKSLLGDPRVAARMKVCSRCGAGWGPPVSAILGYNVEATVLNPVGGRCPKCEHVFCRNCAAKIGGQDKLYCPSCKAGVPRGKNVELDCAHY